jgi:methylated-DNA-protein-cysteine methyltransferase-like protein
MERSAAFARIKNEVLAMVRAIPKGRVTTYAAIGHALDVMPRHVAHILATLEAKEARRVPSHGVTQSAGRLTRTHLVRAIDQTIRLANEGVIVEDDTVQDFEDRFALPKTKRSSSDGPPTKRPPPTG